MKKRAIQKFQQILNKTSDSSSILSQTEQKLKKDYIQTEKEANKTHYYIGKNIREVIEKNGGTMPEDLPTPEKSLKQLEKEKNNMLKNNK